VLLQPGAPTEFNRLRLPSKLQAYLASGTPTVTFAVGFGEQLEDRREALKTYTAEPGELADRIVEVLEDEQLRACLAVGGPAAARRLFDPGTNTDKLEAHYRAVQSKAAGRP
jgi:glycosyltransferase involved in cell wall biosynthesis